MLNIQYEKVINNLIFFL